MTITFRLLLLTAGIMTITLSRSFAQYEYLSTFDYQNLTVNRLSNIPGVTRVTGNSTYDQITSASFSRAMPPVHSPSTYIPWMPFPPRCYTVPFVLPADLDQYMVLNMTMLQTPYIASITIVQETLIFPG